MAWAVVGMDALLPGASSAEEWIANSRVGTPSLREVPAGRWPFSTAEALSLQEGAADKTLTLNGGFVEGVPADPCAWVRRVVRNALGDGKRDHQRTDLILASLGLPSTGSSRKAWSSLTHAVRFPEVDGPLLHQEQPATEIALELGFGGAVVSLDAACASGLYAVGVACERLKARECDLAIAAAVNAADSAFLFLGFSQLRALSKSGLSRPFDERADGLLVGEGAAAVVVKRLEDAIRDKDKIHAVIRGTGFGNDGRKGNPLAPDSIGQRRAISRAWETAGVSPASVGLIECHATGTALGDASEVSALNQWLQQSTDAPTQPVVLASAKALIGHTVTVAGLAGLIRTIGAVRDGFLPPTTCEQPMAQLQPHFRLVSAPSAWESPIRRAAVSAFGFGGTNAHVVVDNIVISPPSRVSNSIPLVIRSAAATLGKAESQSELQQALLEGRDLREPASVQLHRGPGMADGTYVENIRLNPSLWRVPPKELEEWLPQHLLFLEVARRALDAVPEVDRERMASIVGMSVDPRIFDHVARWGATEPDRISPPLSATRVQGLLPNLVANRIAGLLDLQGPSFTIAAGGLSFAHALAHAQKLIASGEVTSALVGAVDLRAHPGLWRLSPDEPIAEGAVAVVVTATGGGPKIVQISFDRGITDTPAHHDTAGHVGAADGAFSWLEACWRGKEQLSIGDLRLGDFRAHLGLVPGQLAFADPMEPRPLTVPHSLPTPLSDGLAPPMPRKSAVKAMLVHEPVDLPMVPLSWPVLTPTKPIAKEPMVKSLPSSGAPKPIQTPAIAAKANSKQTLPLPTPPIPLQRNRPSSDILQQGIASLQDLMAAVAKTSAAVTSAQAEFLANEHQALAQLEQLTRSPALSKAPLRPTSSADRTIGTPERPKTVTPQKIAAPQKAPLPAPQPDAPLRAPRQFDRAALEKFATGKLSEALGPLYADLDAYEPRTRLPSDPLLLVSRVLDVEGERGHFGKSRIITEYDIPADAWWSHDGKAPPCIIVESGQADLFLVSYLGIDEQCRGKRIYRLLDCDLTFHSSRPPVGETLRHNIRINRFARLGETTLFYFEYDCTNQGVPTLSMRQGVAGFFTPEELKKPQGVRTVDEPYTTTNPFSPRFAGVPRVLTDSSLRALENGDYAAAFGSGFSLVQTDLRLPSAPWRLLHRVKDLRFEGGPHGWGGLRAEQDLRDDDWFNPCHFQGDPCMPGTLMFDGCMQALTVWLMGMGWVADYPNATFEPILELTTKLRCRGQVVPGHSRLEYEVRVKSAGMEPAPYAIADVILHVDGVAVVRAEDVGVRIEGERRIPRTFDEAKVLEFSVGLPSKAFGPAFLPFDHGRRTSRMPGPPYLTMSRVVDVDGEPGKLAAGRSVTIEYDLPPDAWYFTASPGTSLAFAVLTEIALQPCGWLTVYQHASLPAGGDLYFRNLGGTGRMIRNVQSDAGTLTTRVVQTSVSKSGGMLLHSFVLSVNDRIGPIFEGETQFGYFTADSLLNQKGLPPDPKWDILFADPMESIDLSALPQWGILPRSDLRMIDRAWSGTNGVWRAEKDVNPREWFFTAHFHQDPVMPGSLGLEALCQLARVALAKNGITPEWIEPIASGSTVTWKYRGQVPPTRKMLAFELKVHSLVDGVLTADGRVLGDGLPIYELKNLVVRAVSVPAPVVPQLPVRSSPASALIDRFTVTGNIGEGSLLLDERLHPWLADHRPTVTIPAVPLAFSAEIAAEAAALLCPGEVVSGITSIEAKKWLIADGPTELRIHAQRDENTVQVTLSQYSENRRFPKLSGWVPHVVAKVTVGPASQAPAVFFPGNQAKIKLSPEAYYSGGLTFHGPTLQAMTQVGTRGQAGATATLRTRSDADLLPEGSPKFVLDPLLLDAATHPMWSGEPEVWNPDIPAGQLAYPIACENLRIHGPRPEGEIECRLFLVEASLSRLIFDVQLGSWCSFRWTEAILPGGPILGAPSALRRRFCWEKQADPSVAIGRPTPDGWEVTDSDLVEPLEGTLIRLYRSSNEPVHPARSGIAVKEAVRLWFRERLHREVHPATFTVACLEPHRWIVTDASTLTADEFIEHLGPTRFFVQVDETTTRTVARIHR